MALVSIIIMYLIETIINTGYLHRSILKVVFFLILPMAYTLYDKNIRIKDNFKIKSKGSLMYSALLGVGVYAIILSAYFILKNLIDLSNIINRLDKNMGVDKNNFLAIALYISFVNSLLEEFFFRGFIFANLNRISGRVFANIMSAFIFSIYHVAIMGSWFSPLIFIIAMAGLFVGALIFNYLNEKGGNIYHSWLVHLMAKPGN